MWQVPGRHTTSGMATGDTNCNLEQGFVPFLPDDVALQCLYRVPAQSHVSMQGVSRKWRDLVKSSEFHEQRKKQGTTGHCVCLLQAIPQSETPQQQEHPMYSVSTLDERLGTWKRLPPIPELTPQTLPLFCRFAAVSGKLVVLGGWDPSTWETLPSVHIFNFSKWSWSRGADMPTVRSFFTCGVLGQDIIVAGGHDNNKNALRSADIYNLEQDTWDSLPNMTSERDECAAAVLDGKLFVISGYETASQGEFLRDAEMYDPVENCWTRVDDMWTLGSKSVSPSSIITTAGRLFAFHLNQLLCYSPETNAWDIVDYVPEGDRGIATPVCATGFGNSIIVTGPWSAEDKSYRTLVYKLPAMGLGDDFRCKGHWDTAPLDGHFLGVAQVSCVVEI